ncbi:MAG: RdgB/HAM1 family non-canonical purine NTP pyrophosphatase [Candidatus Aminicenantes bacterium]|nr:RdgB/HAM1 family non-canonical purine NTP pyrophosphatase [Candidatus Aminicenantes bacterium]
MTERRLLLATRNPGKVREIRRALRGIPLKIIGLEDVLPGLSHRERGTTFSAIARAKGLYYSRKWDGLILAEDSGLEIEALDGAPGVRSARFSGPKASGEKNNRKVLRLLRKVPAAERKARFVCVMALAKNGSVVREFRGEVRGEIVLVPRGASGFGYDPLFYYPPLRQTFAELPADVKNAVSHRGRAVLKLRAFLEAEKKAPPGRLPGRAAVGR